MMVPARLAACLGLFALRVGAQIFGGQAVQPKLVKLSVVALDGKGQPVGDLTADDFQISDAGKAQKVALFRHGDARLRQEAPLKPGELSNRAASNVQHATLILFDLLNQSFSARGGAESFLVKGLQSLESADNLYLYLLTQDAKLYPVHPLPGPEIDASAPAATPWTRDSKPLIDQAISKVYRLRALDMDIDTRVRLTYRSLENVADMLGGIPGRKNVVWITHGVPISIRPEATYSNDGIDYTPMLRRLSFTLNRLSVAIYPVQQVPPGMALEGTPEAQYSGVGSQETLQQFADLTGGSMKAGGDIDTAVRHAMNDVRTSYVLGYYPPAENWDGKFHKLRVACGRKGVKLQAKTGYYAWEETAGGEQEALDVAAAGSFDASEIGIRGISSPGARPHSAHIDVRIDAGDVQMNKEGDRYTAHLALQATIPGPDGKTQRTELIPLDLSLTAEEQARMLRDGIPFTQDLAMDGSPDRVRLLVLDRGTHAVGSLTLPVPK